MTPNQPTIVVCGSVHYDLMLKVPHLPGDNDRITPTAVTLAPGGMGGNVAAAAARLGGNVRFVGMFGDNADGDSLRDDLIRDGVDVVWAGKRNAGARYRGTILVDSLGQRAILGSWPDFNELEKSPGQAPGQVTDLTKRGSARDSARRYAFGDFNIPSAAFAGNNVAFAAPFNFASLVLDQVPPHIPVFLDLETGHVQGWTEGDIWKTLQRARVIYGNQRNLADLARRLDQPSVTALSGASDRTFVETAGELGCELHESGKRSVIPGFRVETVDSTGAGDCFAATCTLELQRGHPLAHAARIANAAAALSTRRLGSRPGVPNRSELESFISGAPSDSSVFQDRDPFRRFQKSEQRRETLSPDLFARTLLDRIQLSNDTKGRS